MTLRVLSGIYWPFVCSCFKEYLLRLHSLLDFYSFAIHFLRFFLYILNTCSVKWTVRIFLPFFRLSLALLIESTLGCCNDVIDSFISGAVEFLPGKPSPVLISWRCPSLFLAVLTLGVFDGNEVSKFKNCQQKMCFKWKMHLHGQKWVFAFCSFSCDL